MKLTHYTDEKFDLQPFDYSEDLNILGGKPVGLWVSVDGEQDWKSWCISQEFYPNNLTVSYEVKLKKDAHILYLKNTKEIFEFSRKYVIKEEPHHPKGLTFRIDWNKVKERYQGIIIDPYQWECRFDVECCWYYGWDCASGCIWDISCIEEFNLIEQFV